VLQCSSVHSAIIVSFSAPRRSYEAGREKGSLWFKLSPWSRIAADRHSITGRSRLHFGRESSIVKQYSYSP